MVNKLKLHSIQLGIVLILFLITIIGISSYISKKFRTPSVSNNIENPKDIHDCLIENGFYWCDAKNKCLNPSEEYCTKTTPKITLFICDNSKNILASFYIGDDKYVDLILSDGRKISVPRAISASGARYANADESFVFWNKGDTAFITENDKTIFSNCVTKTQ